MSDHLTGLAKVGVTMRCVRWREIATQAALGILIGWGILRSLASIAFPQILNEEQEGPPVMVAEMTSLDFGIVRPGAELLGSISVANYGAHRLVLSEISEVCACVANHRASYVVPAGESLSIPVKYRVRGPSSTPNGTPEQFVVRFTTSDPQHAMFEINLQAEVRSEYEQEVPTLAETNLTVSQTDK